MARSAETKPMKKMTVRFYEDDLEYLRDAYPGTGYNSVVRALASRHVRRLRAATQEAMADKLSPEELRLV